MNIQQSIKDYYGKTLKSSADLKTDACCMVEAVPERLRPLYRDIHPEVAARYYGCGLVAPTALEGARILDLGCGSGQDAFLLARLAGEEGSVVGVDFTPEQLAVARQHVDWHAERYGYRRPNVAFVEGDIERLGDLGLEEASFDVIVSNCVINLCSDKQAVFSAARRLLKPGGEFYFSDIYADRRLAGALCADPVARGECLGGALYWNDFLTIAKRAGFPDPRLVADRPLAINDGALKERLAPAMFWSATYRLFAIEGLETTCEDYGQAVIYKGSIPGAETVFKLDAHHCIEKGRIFPVCGNTYRMLSESRFAKWFEFFGDATTHYGIFPDCGSRTPFGAASATAAIDGACC